MLTSPPSPPERVAFYARVSSEEQAESGTIQNQVEYARRYADLNKLDVVGWYLDDGVSGTLPMGEREQGRQLLSDAKAGKLDVALVYRVDRLARRLSVLLSAQAILQEHKVGLRSMTEPIDTTTPIGRFVFQLLGSIAELERETIVERSILGTNRQAAAGKWLGGIVPYGYRVADGYLQVSEEALPGLDYTEAEVVRLIYRLMVEEQRSTVYIADYLNAHGIPPSYAKDGRLVTRGKRQEHTSGFWQPGRIRNMIVQPIYKGIHYYGRRTKRDREVIERPMPAIVAVETWEAAQRQLKANQIYLSPQNAKRDHLLRGLITCGVCGLNYIGGAAAQRQRAYYKCNGRTSYRGKLRGKCPSKIIDADEIEGQIWGQIVKWAHDPGEPLRELRAKMQSGLSDKSGIEGESERVEAAIARKQKERDTILRLLRQETITYAEGEKHLGEIGKEVAILEAERQTLFAKLHETIDFETHLMAAEDLLRSLRSKVEHADNATKREIIQKLVKSITVETIGEGKERRAHVVVVFHCSAVARTGTRACDRDTLTFQRVWVA